MSMGKEGREVENAVSAYRLILLIRRFEEKAGQLYAMGLIPDEVKLCIGREALFTGLRAARKSNDPIIVGRRSHGCLLALGVAPVVLMSELANPSRGLFDPPSHRPEDNPLQPAGFYRCPTDNGDRARWAMSLAMAQSLKDKQRVVFVILDGDSLEREQIARSLMFAKRFRLQIVFMIDHAAPQPTPRHASGDGPTGKLQDAIRANPISFSPVDGLDPQKVMAACLKAGDAARSGAGPQGLLISTQAFRGHASQQTISIHGAFSQPIHDPVAIARQRLIDASEGRTDTALAIEKDVRTTLTTIGLNIRSHPYLEG